MSVILDALAKARRDGPGERPATGLTDTRALEGGHQSREGRGRARGGLLFFVICASVAVTLVLCAAGFYLLALKTGAIAPGWPVTALVPSGGTSGKAGTSGGAGEGVGHSGAIGDPSTEPTGAAPGAVTGNGQFPAPAPLSVAVSHRNGGGAGLAELPPPDELPIWIQQSPQPPAGVAPGQPAPVAQPAVAMVSDVVVPAIAAAAPVAAPAAALPAIKIGTILCDESGCTAAANGQTVRVGDVILDYTVMAVTADKVTLQRAGEAPIVLRPRS